jgi:hypothetical protein
MITRTYYWDGKLISEFIPPENFFVDPTVELRADIATLTRRVAELEAALEPFAKMGRMLVGTFALALFRDDQPISLGDAWKENGETRTITFGDLRTAAKALAHTLPADDAAAVLTRKLAIAESALELFSGRANEYNSEAGDWLDDHWASHKDNITVGDLRRARKALAAIREQHTPTAMK